MRAIIVPLARRIGATILGGWSANLTLPDYGRVARHPGVSGIDSHKPTFRYGIVEKQLASVGVPPCEDGSRRSSASISHDVTTGNLPHQACELPMDAFDRRIAFSL